MSLFNKKMLLATVLSATMITGCGTSGTKEGGDVPPPSTTTAPEAVKQPVDDSAKAKAMEEQAAVTARKLAEQQAKAKTEAARLKEKQQVALREVRTFYFDFDKAELKAESRMSLLAHAAYLSSNSSAKVVLEGYCDERGTREYNLALGEGRAKSVERFLVINGVSRSQITVKSYGEEKPAEMGHDEASWAKNRRAVVVYQ